MKKLTGILISFLTVFLTGCSCQCNNQQIGDVNYIHPDFHTEYTTEQHIERIKERTEKIFKKEILKTEIANIYVDIVHAFYDDDPEYFLIEIEFYSEISGSYTNPYNFNEQIEYTTKYQHVIGFIKDDQYYVGLNDYSGNYASCKGNFHSGESSYRAFGQPFGKKYYGCQTQGIYMEGEILMTSSRECSFPLKNHPHGKQSVIYTECPIGSAIPKTKYKTLMEENNKFHYRIYEAVQSDLIF